MIIDLLRRRLSSYRLTSPIRIRLSYPVVRRRYVGPVPDTVYVQSPTCNNCIAVATANALRSVYPGWSADIDTTFAKAGGTCESGVDDITFLNLGVYHGSPFDVKYVYRVVTGLEQYLPRMWLGLGAFNFKGMYHVVYIYGFDEKSYYVINAYPGWGDNYRGRIPKRMFARLYAVRPTHPKPSWSTKSGSERIL